MLISVKDNVLLIATVEYEATWNTNYVQCPVYQYHLYLEITCLKGLIKYFNQSAGLLSL